MCIDKVFHDITAFSSVRRFSSVVLSKDVTLEAALK